MIPLFKPYMPKDIMQDLETILYSGQLSFGEWGIAFEEKMRAFLQTDNFLSVSSYPTAINIVCKVLGIKSGDEVIVSPLCCLQSTQPLLALGLKVVWADVNPKTGTLCPDSVRSKITANTKAIFHNQHLGYVGYIADIQHIAKEFGVFVIDDCIDGIGGEYQNKKIGNCGSDATVMSFNAVRLPNAVGGGGIAFKDNKHIEKAIITRDLGVDRRLFRNENEEINPNCDIKTIGYAGTMNAINTYIAYKQMNTLPKLIKKQRENAQLWQQVITENNSDCMCLDLVENTLPTYWVFGLLSENRDKSIAWFKEKGFFASRVHYPNNNYSVFTKQEALKGVNDFYERFLALPCGWWLNKKDIAL